VRELTLPDLPPLADRALERLRALGQGNGLKPDDFEILEKTEATMTLSGELRLSPAFDRTVQNGIGPLKSQNAVQLPSIAALEADVAQRKASFDSSKTWVQEVVQELETDPTHGWGQQDAMISLPQQTALLGATDNCPTCGGRGHIVCSACNGQRQVFCTYCEGRREEPCYHCQTTGQDPAHPNLPCPVCHGTRFAPCRYCHATGMIDCPTCQGKGGTTCTTCRGTGKVSQLVKLTVGAKTAFKLKDTTGLSSNLLRALDQLGMANLGKGHADIGLQAQKEEDDPRLIPMQATFPYIEIKLRVVKSTASFAILGKRNALLGVPAFLDRALKPWRDHLEAAAKDPSRLHKAIEARALRDAVALTIAGKTKPIDLRRLYPYGLSPRCAQDIMVAARKALNKLTQRAEIGGGVLAILISAGLAFAARSGAAKASLAAARHGALTPATLGLVALGLALGFVGTTQAARFQIRRELPNATPPALGKPSALALALAALAGLIPVALAFAG
jgi:hypothetical protein